MFFLPDIFPDLLYAAFGLCDNALATACMVWLCWQFPTFGRRRWRALMVAGLLLFGSPFIVSIGYCVSHLSFQLSWMSVMFPWNFLWTVMAIPLLTLMMVLIRRVTGIVVSRPGNRPPPRQPISIGDLFVWTFVVALMFAVTGTVSNWINSAMSSFGASLNGSAAIGFIGVQVFAFATNTYLLLPNLKSSIWVRAIGAYTIYLLSRATLVVFASVSGDTSAFATGFLITEAIRGIPLMLGIILGHRLLMAKGYQYWLRPKAAPHETHYDVATM